MKYIVEVTTSNPSHEHISLRRVQKKTNFVVEASNETEALNRARNKFRSLGHYVHNATIAEMARRPTTPERPVPNPNAVPKTPPPGEEPPAVPGHPLEAERAKIEAEVEKRKLELQKQADEAAAKKAAEKAAAPKNEETKILERITLGAPVAPQVAAKEKISKDMEDKEDTALARINRDIEDTKETNPEYSKRAAAFKAEWLKKKAAADAADAADALRADELQPVKIKSQKRNMGEETQYIEEKLTGADPASKWISDFVRSDNPKFAGASKKERIQQALGAYYAAKRSMKEEVEQINEGPGYLRYTGEVNGKPYEYTVRAHSDLTDNAVHRALKRDNDHLEPHEIKAIVHSGGEEESHVEVTHKGKSYTHHVINEPEPDHLYEEVQQINEGPSHFLYTGEVNGKSYEYTVPADEDISDDETVRQALHDENDHLEPHEIEAIVKSGGEEESHVEVTHGKEKYKHHVINDQEPRHMYLEEVEQVAEAKRSKLVNVSTVDRDEESDDAVNARNYVDAGTSAQFDSPEAVRARIQKYGSAQDKRQREIDDAEHRARLTDINFPGFRDQWREIGNRVSQSGDSTLQRFDRQADANLARIGRTLDASVQNQIDLGNAMNKRSIDIFSRPFQSNMDYLKQKVRAERARMSPAERKAADAKAAAADANAKKSDDDIDAFLGKFEQVERVNEKLIGNQHKIDANKSGHIDAHDFKLLRAKKKVGQKEPVNELVIKGLIKAAAKRIDDKIVGGRIVPGSGGAGGMPPRSPVAATAGDIPKPRPSTPEPADIINKPVRDMTADEYARMYHSRAAVRRATEKAAKTGMYESKTQMDRETRMSGGNETTATSITDPGLDNKTKKKSALEVVKGVLRDASGNLLRGVSNAAARVSKDAATVADKVDPETPAGAVPKKNSRSISDTDPGLDDNKSKRAADTLVRAAKDKAEEKRKLNKIDVQPTMPTPTVPGQMGSSVKGPK